mgnify:CR=1 FL=1
MAELEKVPLRKLIAHNPRILEYMEHHHFVLIARRKSTGEQREMPIRALLHNDEKFYRSNTDFEYLLTAERAAELLQQYPEYSEIASEKQEKSEAPNVTEEPTEVSLSEFTGPAAAPTKAGAPTIGEDSPPNYGSDYDQIVDLPPEELVELLSGHTQKMTELGYNADPDVAIEMASEASSAAAMANKAAIDQALLMSNDEAKHYTKNLKKATEDMVARTQKLLDTYFYKSSVTSALIQKSNGTVVQHIARVFLMGFSFLLYYNQQYTNTSMTSRIRTRFAAKYRNHYRQLLPHLEKHEITLERVFYNGMRSLSFAEIRTAAVGFLLHDIGKAESIEYHEGEKGYDRDVIMEHVKIGYKAIMEKSLYPREAAIIAGYHHEYYGDPFGYGYFREMMPAYRKLNPKSQLECLMSYEIEPLLTFQVLAYFPAKMLEIVDVYDSLTDKNRRYRNALSPQQTMKVLHQDFVLKNLRLDPILLDLFEDFLQYRGIL